MDRIRIAQIGTGHGHAAGKMQVYRRSPDFEVVGIAEPDETKRQQLAKDPAYRDIPVLTVEGLLDLKGLQAVAIETDVRDLLTHAEACVERRLPIHLDKPAGESLLQFRRILDTATKAHIPVQMGYMYRYNPAFVMLREYLSQGWLGEPFEVHAVMSKVVGPAERKELAGYPGGMMFELGCHLIDALVDVLGPCDKITPYVRSSTTVNDGLADNMLAVFEYPRATATVRSSALEVEGFSRRHFVVCGTEGTFHIEPLDRPTVRLALSRPRGSAKRGLQTVEIAPYDHYVADAADFADCIRTNRPLRWTPMHDLAVQEAVLRASGCPLDR